jgi:hypothetical protein
MHEAHHTGCQQTPEKTDRSTARHVAAFHAVVKEVQGLCPRRAANGRSTTSVER